jgi:glycosyltransferase involved in cell wall biosynthesis
MCGVSGPTSRSRGRIGDFKYCRELIFELIEQILALGVSDRDSCLEIKEKLEANSFNLVAVGQFKRGKTCLINALLGAPILPVSVVPLTSVVTVLVYGETPGARVFFKNGKAVDIPVKSLSDYVTETANPKNEKEILEVTVFYPSPYLKDGVRLVDTPGVGSVYVHNTDIAYRYLPKSDAALFLLSTDQPAGSAEIEFLKDVRQYASRIFFLLNKTDYLSAQEVAKALSFARQTIEQIMGPEVRMFPISAKLALQAKLDGSPETLVASGLPDFSEALGRFLVKEKGKVLIESVCGNLQKVLSRARLETELELKSLATPIEQIREKIAAFEGRKQELSEEKRTFDTLFRAEIEHLIRELDSEIGDLKRRLFSEMKEEFHRFYESKRDLSLKELNDALEGFVLEKIQTEFSAWHDVEDEKLAGSFDAICARFAAKVNQVTDSLLDFSSRLFSVPFESVEAESLWTSKSSFHYKLRGDAVGLDMLAESITQLVPKYISRRWKFQRVRDWAFRTANRIIFDKRKRHMLETIEMQAGRLRADFIRRLNLSASHFRSRLVGDMENTSSAIARAIENGVNLRRSGEEEAAAIESRLTERLSALERIKGELLHIREDYEELD